jgi:thiol:disulfide interchange protein DsbC
LILKKLKFQIYLGESRRHGFGLCHRDGQYIIQGDVIRLGDKQLQNVSEALQATENKKHLAALKTEDLIVYPAQGGKAKHVIYVFTDSSCPYCHKLHEHLAEINAKGIEVRYIAWPRGEQFMPTMQAIWCSEDRKAAFDQAARLPVAAAECKNPVRDQYQLGKYGREWYTSNL